MVLVVVNKKESCVLITSLAYFLKMKARLQSGLVRLCTSKLCPLSVESAKEIGAMVITCYGKTWEIVLHLGTEPLLVTPLQRCCCR